MPTAIQSPSAPLGSEYEGFTIWSKERGVTINKIHPARIPGRGLGIVAEHRIQAGEELVSVPIAALLTEGSVPKGFKKRVGDITVHGLLAAFLAFGGVDVKRYQPWQATWPSMADFRDCMPMLWSQRVRSRSHRDKNGIEQGYSLSPPAARDGSWAHHSLSGFSDRMSKGLLLQQEASFESDWEILNGTFPKAAKGIYQYYWLIVNTRSFYFELPGMEETTPKEDRMVLCPFVDFFNHADHGCDVAFDDEGYTITADRAYDVGEELYLSYGSHSNDFLLVEYGFILENNKWDSLPIDDLLIPTVLDSKLRRNRLERAGYLGSYTLTAQGVCYRTEVAIRALVLSYQDWKKFLRTQASSKADEADVAAFVDRNILQVYLWEADEALKTLTSLPDEGFRSQKEMMIKRWTQIRNVVQQARRHGIES